jgi:hypothetical protein
VEAKMVMEHLVAGGSDSAGQCLPSVQNHQPHCLEERQTIMILAWFDATNTMSKYFTQLVMLKN